MVVVGQAIFGQGFGISMMGKEVLFGVFWGEIVARILIWARFWKRMVAIVI